MPGRPGGRMDRTMYATFDLRGAAHGVYDLQIERPDGVRVVKADAFEVRAGTGARLENTRDCSGRDPGRLGFPI